jgi:integration host factor subunit alpha
MTREHLTNAVAKELQITQAAAYDIVLTVLDSIKQGLINDGKVTIRGFGCFNTRNKSKRMGRNPKTGRAAVITARRVISFKAYDPFKQLVNVPNKI